MTEHFLDPYEYEDLPEENSFRVIDLQPGQGTDPVSCTLRIVDWLDHPEYEAISYAWGNPDAKAPVVCDGKKVEVTKNLHAALVHLRRADQARTLWADALCINQSNIPERSLQVRQMQKIYRHAKAVLVWLGPSTQDDQAKKAIRSIGKVSDFLCQRLNIPIPDPDSGGRIYQELVLKNRENLPRPDRCNLGQDVDWESLIWLFSHPYFSRVWVLQELNANIHRIVYCGFEKTEWDRLDLVASYMIMDPSFSKGFGFANTYCWWAATVAEMSLQPRNWLSILYLASNYGCLDARDIIYGLRGLMKFSKGEKILYPDYGKSVIEVYRDSVEAALVNFENTDAILYTTGEEDPSWIPRWDQAMLFRNPFRFGKPVPWKPAGATKPIWYIDKNLNELSVSGFVVDTIDAVQAYNERWFSLEMTQSEEGRNVVRQGCDRILKTIEGSQFAIPFSAEVLTAVATSLSYGLDENIEPGCERRLLENFVAYLKSMLSEESFSKYIPSSLADDSKNANGAAFGKPVWDFEYPESSFFVTKHRLVGCAISATAPGDVVSIALGSTYPTVLRPDVGGDYFRIRGFSFVYGLMSGERRDSEAIDLKLR